MLNVTEIFLLILNVVFSDLWKVNEVYYSFSEFFRHICYVSEAYSEPSQRSQMKLYEETVNS